MQAQLYVRDPDGSFILSATLDAASIALRPRAVWNDAQPVDQHGTAMPWAYDDQRSIVLSPLKTLMIDSSAWTLHGVGIENLTLKVFVSPVAGFADPFAEKREEKGGEKGGVYPFVAKGADVHHGMQLVATATSSNLARRIAEALTLYRGRLSADRRDARRRAEKGVR